MLGAFPKKIESEPNPENGTLIVMSNPILITGADKRVGLALSKALIKNGFPIIATYRQKPGQLLELKGATLFQADLSNPPERSALINFINHNTSALRGIIHNASMWLEDSLENLATMYQIHIEAPFHLNEALSEHLKKSGRADIIHICDDTASRGSRNHVAYAATKAALANMTLSFAEKLAPSVRVNSISPGLLNFKENSHKKYKEKVLKKALLEFEPGPEPLLEAALYLLSVSYSTGSNIVINGGRHLRKN